MKLKNQIVAGVMAAALIITSVPAVNVNAAKIKYTGTYTKDIEIERVETTTKKDSSKTALNSDLSVNTLATNDTATIVDNTNNSQTTGDGKTTNGTDSATIDPSTLPVVEAQDENVRVMAGMKFMISATRYGTLIKTNKNKSQFRFKSSNKKIAKVTSKGVVQTIKNGKCDITITDKKDGTVYIMHLTVAKSVKVKDIKLNTYSKTYKKKGKGKSFQLTAEVTPDKYDNIPVYWGSTDNSVATVDYKGLVTVKDYGECEIYCKAGSNNKIAKCTVTAKDPNANSEEGNGTGYSKLTYRTGKLVDISSHNTVSNWEQLKKSCDGVIIRCGYRGYSGGTLNEDIKFRSNVFNCQQHGIPFSVYFYTTALTEAEGVEEGNYIANLLGGMNISMPVFIDTESSGTGKGRSDNMSKAARTAAVRGACSQLQARGIPAGVYASTYWLYNNIDMSQLPYSVWAADYRGYCGYSGSKFAWQYTSSATGYGVANRCDVSNWYN
ncbi:GH25 family lysozyme [Butyrivibrio sp. AE3004]|uniref:GH25 family lysozyme n=1 Tax=Butyrivibrio sp. AE3004 TaxID=1506994 RepID=UPI0004942161|nr:GH25 family lysozyme [Butyrivibrio sp. AE3004]